MNTMVSDRIFKSHSKFTAQTEPVQNILHLLNMLLIH